MNIRDTLEKATESIGAQMRGTADNLIEKIGSESRQLGEKVGDSIVARVGDLSDTALARLNLVSKQRARQQTMMGVLAGFFIGVVIARMLGGDAGAKRRQAMRNRFPSGDEAYTA